jgi:hypothetical protein
LSQDFKTDTPIELAPPYFYYCGTPKKNPS